MCTISKSSLLAPHSGHTQSSGKSSQRVPGAMPSSVHPFSSSKHQPQIKHIQVLYGYSILLTPDRIAFIFCSLLNFLAYLTILYRNHIEQCANTISRPPEQTGQTLISAAVHHMESRARTRQAGRLRVRFCREDALAPANPLGVRRQALPPSGMDSAIRAVERYPRARVGRTWFSARAQSGCARL